MGAAAAKWKKIWIFISIILGAIVLMFFQVQLWKLEEDKNELELTVVRLSSAQSAVFQSLANNFPVKAPPPENDNIIIYNRVPKTASTSFVNVAYDLCKRNRFNVLHLNVSGNSHIMSIADQARFVYNVTHWEAKKPGLYHGHVAFINFEKFGKQQKPIYINLLRKPLDRLVSYYYFLRHGDNFRPYLVRKKHGDNMTFDECVLRRHSECSTENLWLQVPFMCGHSPLCWIPGNEWALEEAKRNLLNKYLLVGITENLNDFIALLESALPRFFRGAIEHFKSSSKAHLRKTNYKLEPTKETVSLIKQSKIWKMENELYEFAVMQFEFAKKRMGIDREGRVFDKGQQFFFEKISPKNPKPPVG